MENKKLLEYSVVGLIIIIVFMVLYNGFAAHSLIVNLNKSVLLDMQLKKDIKANSSLIVESAVALGTRALEESSMVQPSDANKLVEDSINRISSANIRVGQLMKYIDNAILSNRINKK